MEANQPQIKDTTATKKIFRLKKRIRVAAGGTAASKTMSILIWCIDYAQSTKGKLVSVVSESFPHLSGGAMLDFERIMKDRSYWNDKRWVRTPRATYTFETGSKIEFVSVDTYGKAHGPRRDVLFINEANNLNFNIADQLITRTRDVVWMDWNPTSEFWFYTEMLNKRDDIDFITLTYLDNEAIDEGTLSELLSRRERKDWWRVYGEGLLGEIEGKIYTGWKIIDEIPHEARLERYGLDFGYTNDPTAIVAIYYYNDGYIFDEIAFLKGLSNKQIADIFLNNSPAMVTADSAEPKSIDEIRGYGINILPAIKGKDSIQYGIQAVQNLRVSVTKRSINIIKEYRNYLWMVDKNGIITGEPEHRFSHSMDAIRYAVTSLEPVISREEQIKEMKQRIIAQRVTTINQAR